MTTEQKRLARALKQANSEIAAYLAAIGRKGGAAKSKAKSKSSAANGRLGGRPKKYKPR